MSEPSLKNRIVRFLRNKSGEWVPKGDLEREAILAGYLADNLARRCRELYAEGFLDRRENEKGHVEYRARESTLLPID